MNKDNKNSRDIAKRAWQKGVMFLGLFAIIFIKSFPVHSIIDCDKNDNYCHVEQYGFYKAEYFDIPLNSIKTSEIMDNGRRLYRFVLLTDRGQVNITDSYAIEPIAQSLISDFNIYLKSNKIEKYNRSYTNWVHILTSVVSLLLGVRLVFISLKPYIKSGLTN